MTIGSRFGISDSLLDSVNAVMGSDRELETVAEKNTKVMMPIGRRKDRVVTDPKLPEVPNNTQYESMHGDVYDPNEAKGLMMRGTIKKLRTKAKHSRGADKERGEDTPVMQGNSHLKPPMGEDYEIVAIDEEGETVDVMIDDEMYVDVPLDVLDELSRKTLGSYIGKAASDLGNKGYRSSEALARGDVKGSVKELSGRFKRQAGIEKAAKKLAKEDLSLAERIKSHADDATPIDEEVNEVLNEMYGETMPMPNDPLARASVYLSRACDDIASATGSSNMYEDKPGAKELERIHDAVFDVGSKLRTAWRGQISAKRAWRNRMERKRG